MLRAVADTHAVIWYERRIGVFIGAVDPVHRLSLIMTNPHCIFSERPKLDFVR